MKIFKALLLFFALILLICFGLIISGNSHLIKAVKSTYLVGKTGPSILDYSKFTNDNVKAGKHRAWDKKEEQLNLNQSDLDDILAWETTALLILKDKEVIFEQYWDGFNSNSYSNSFSMAKSFTSIAIGVAIKEGKIKSVNQAVSDFIPEFNTPEKKDITIKHLLTMSSGIDFGESYGDPFGFMARTYYGKELYDLTLSKPAIKLPGTEFHYQGGNTLLLSFILEKATGKPLSEYFSEKIWKPIEAKNDALWSITEKDQKLKSYCCFYSNAQDFARIGQLYLDSGKWNGKSIIDHDYFNSSIKPINIKNKAGKNIDYYGYQWWLGSHEELNFFYARGILGQYIVVIPEKKIVLVRLGHKRDKTRNVKIPKDLFVYLNLLKDI